jgi:pimeloyl-ACP methyl ester carboxylesterase
MIPMPFAESSTCRIYYRLQGEARLPLLVLVHALGLDHTMWDPQIASLLNAFRVLRLDLRGHGAGGIPVVDAAGGTRFAYRGLSLGGMIGQYLGARAAKRLTHLVLANTSPCVPDPAFFDARAKTALAEGMPALEQSVMDRLLPAARLRRHGPHRLRGLLRRHPRYGPPPAAGQDSRANSRHRRR